MSEKHVPKQIHSHWSFSLATGQFANGEFWSELTAQAWWSSSSDSFVDIWKCKIYAAWPRWLIPATTPSRGDLAKRKKNNLISEQFTWPEEICNRRTQVKEPTTHFSRIHLRCDQDKRWRVTSLLRPPALLYGLTSHQMSTLSEIPLLSDAPLESLCRDRYFSSSLGLILCKFYVIWEFWKCHRLHKGRVLRWNPVSCKLVPATICRNCDWTKD